MRSSQSLHSNDTYRITAAIQAELKDLDKTPQIKIKKKKNKKKLGHEKVNDIAETVFQKKESQE